MILVSFALAGPAYDVLLPRDGASCDALGAATPALRDELFTLAEAPDAVPWVPVRAAGCLVARFAGDPAVVDRLAGWAADPERAGLTLVVLDGAAALRPADAVRIGQAALSIEDARWHGRFADRLRRSSVLELRALDGVDAPKAAQ